MRPDRPSSAPVPFTSVEAAWFATAAMISGGGAQPLWVAQVLRCLDRLYRHRRIDLLHARIMREWGARGVAPLPTRPRERSDWQVWREAMDRLDGPLRSRGLVDGRSIAEAAD